MYILFIILLLPISSFGEDVQQSLLPLPNTEYKFDCGKDQRTLTTGQLVTAKKKSSLGKTEIQYSMNAQMQTGKDTRKLKMEPWNRFVFVSSISQSPDKYTEVSLRSGNLDKVTFTVGSTFTGQITEKNTIRTVEKEAVNDGNNLTTKDAIKDKINTDEWKVIIKIESMSKVQFKGESYVSYRIRTTRTKITWQTWVFNIDAIYIPKIGQFLTSSQAFGTSKSSMTCKLTDMKSIAKQEKK